MDPKKTALILIGYQKDYFAKNGILRGAIEESSVASGTLENTLGLLERIKDSNLYAIQTPIIFTADYSELVSPIGILQTIKEVGAFRRDTVGAEIIDEIAAFGTRIEVIPGKNGLNAFSNTKLDDVLRYRAITDVVLAGAVTSVCIDSTGRSAHERGFRVHVLSDCTCGRSTFEQEFYCGQILPLYANVLTSDDFCRKLGFNS